MRITVHVVPRARRPGVERLPRGGLRVAVAAPPHEGLANEAVTAALAEYFGVPRTRVQIVRGQRGRHKVVDVTMPTA